MSPRDFSRGDSGRIDGVGIRGGKRYETPDPPCLLGVEGHFGSESE